MASGFFALFDDIALLMDDMAAMSQVATKKTAGMLGELLVSAVVGIIAIAPMEIYKKVKTA